MRLRKSQFADLAAFDYENALRFTELGGASYEVGITNFNAAPPPKSINGR